MKFLIIGGSGFLGSHVADHLSSLGHNVLIFDKNQSNYLKKNQRFFKGDIKKIDNYKSIFKSVDYVYNFAGISDIEASKKKPKETILENILPVVKILEMCNKNNVKKFVFASTIYVYSKQGYYYKCSKLSAELYIREFCKMNKLKYGILRYGSLYGPRSNSLNGIYNLLEKIIKNKKINYIGRSDSKREYIHVEDAARASVDLIDKKYDNQSIIITGETSYKLSDIIQIVSEIVGKKIKVNFSNKLNTGTGHYHYTPYNLIEYESKKYTLPFHVDIGQGLIDTIKEIKKDIK
tara:strand:- start:6040 stop:6915 length:876 start_codon:yes stop_codon:yes gene_type:complete